MCESVMNALDRMEFQIMHVKHVLNDKFVCIHFNDYTVVSAIVDHSESTNADYICA